MAEGRSWEYCIQNLPGHYAAASRQVVLRQKTYWARTVHLKWCDCSAPMEDATSRVSSRSRTIGIRLLSRNEADTCRLLWEMP